MFKVTQSWNDEIEIHSEFQHPVKVVDMPAMFGRPTRRTINVPAPGPMNVEQLQAHIALLQEALRLAKDERPVNEMVAVPV